MTDLLQKEKEERATMFFEKAKEYRFNINKNIYLFTVAMRTIRDEKIYEPLGYKSFDLFCMEQDIDIAPATVDNYIKTVELLEEKGVKVLDLGNLPISKAGIIARTKEPKIWIDKAKDLIFTDLKKMINEKDKGVKSDDKEIENYIKKEQAKDNVRIVCPKCGHEF